MKKRRSAQFDVADYGPALTQRGGRWTSTGVGGEVIVEDRPDPVVPNRTTRGARRADTVMALFLARPPRVEAEQWLAAIRFRDDNQLATGISAGSDLLGIGRGSGELDGVQAARVAAQKRTRLAFAALHRCAQGVWVVDAVRCVVLGGATLERYDEGRHIRKGRAKELLDVGLDRLAVHYGIATSKGT